MTTLRVSSGGRIWSFEEPRTVRIGRNRSADVVIESPSVSRHHLELRSTGTGWELVDLGSSGGTWSNGQRVTGLRIGGPLTVRLGDAATGVDLALLPLASASQFAPPGTTTPAPAAPSSAPQPPPAAPVPPVAPPASQPPLRPGPDPTRIPATGGPVGPGAPVGVPGAPAMPIGPGLAIRTNQRTLRFAPGRAVRIGREPGLEVTIEDTAVSRQHALLESRPDGWFWSDRSTGGSYDGDGHRITGQLITEPTTVMLGHPTAGYEIEVVPAVDAATAQRAIARKRRRRGLRNAAIAATAVVVAGVGITVPLVMSGGDEPAAKDAGLARAKQASVFIIAEDADGTPRYTGSGSIISDDGLILTAGHVGDPQAPGEHTPEAAPDKLLIALTSKEDDKPVEAAFEAEPVVTDGVLDLSVLQITADADGDPIDKSDLPDKLPDPIPLGDSDDLSTGDDITALGFPALASLELADYLKPSLSVSRGVVSTFEASDIVDSERAWIDSDVRIGSGNSGGASIDDQGRLIGVNDAVITATTAEGHAGEFTGGSALIRPIALASDIIDIAKKGGDPSYTSPFLDSVPDPTQQTQGVQVQSNLWTKDTGSGCSGTSTLHSPSRLSGVQPGDTIYAKFTVSGMSDGSTTTVRVVDDHGDQLAAGSQPWNLGSGTHCIYLPVPLKSPLPRVAVATFGVAGKPLAQNPVVLH